MKKILSVFLSLLVLSCAGGQSAPEWKTKGRHFLTGRGDASNPYFEKARRELAAGNDLDALSVAYLTKYALHTASLERFDAAPFAKLYKLSPNPAHMSYCHFLKGNFTAVDATLLNDRYTGFLKAALAKDASAAIRELRAIDDPLSRMVAAGVWGCYLPLDERIFQIAIDTAAANGWRRPLWAHLSALALHYENQGENEKARLVNERIELIKR